MTMIDRTNIPFNKNFPSFRFPDFEIFQLKNGIKVFLIPDMKQALAGFRILVKRGAFFDNTEGLTYLSSQMLTRGTKDYTAEEFASTTERLGAVIKATPGFDEMVISGISLGDYFDKIIDLVSGCFFDSVFPEPEFEKIKKQHVSKIMQYNADISFLAKYALQKIVFDGNGYGKPLSGTIKSMKLIKRDMVYENYTDKLQTSPISLFITGNFDKEKTLKTIENTFGKIELKAKDENNKQIKINDDQIAVIEKAASNQSALRLARKTVSRSNPDFPYIQLVNTIFGGFFMSRLNHILREEKGYTYGVHSLIDSRKRTDLHVITTSVNIEKTAESVRIIKDEFDKLRHKTISKEEMERAASYFTGSFLRTIETPAQVTAMLLSLDSLNLGYDYYDKYYEKISNVTLDDLYHTVEKYFSENEFAVSAAGDLNSIMPQMEEFGNLEIIEIEE
jgi:predicted Zn-dependent peptidase